MDEHRLMRLLVVALTVAMTVYLWTLPEVWGASHTGGVIMFSTLFVLLVLVGARASAHVKRTGDASWVVIMLLTTLMMLGGVIITGFSIGNLYFPAALLLLTLTVATLFLVPRRRLQPGLGCSSPKI